MSISDRKKSSLAGSAGKVSAATAVSRVLGLLREQVMAWYFGAGMATDAFVTAFRIPNILRDMFAEGALSSAFVPVFKEKLVAGSEKEAFRLADIIITIILLLVGFIVILGIIASPVIIYLTAHGFIDTPEKFSLTVNLTRIMFVYLLLVSLSALAMGMLNSFSRFGIPALAPALFNVGIILTVIALYQYYKVPIYTLAIGVVVGGIGQLVFQVPSLIKIGYHYKPCFDFLNESVKRVIRLVMPMIIGLSGGRINILVSTLLASFLIEGSISYLNFSFRLMHFPLGVFAVALGTVALPKVSGMIARRDKEGLDGAFVEAMNLNFFLVIPSAVFLMFMGKEVVDLIYQWGAFNENNSYNTTLALFHYSYGLLGFAGVRVVTPFFYAFNDSRLPMKLSLMTVAFNMALYYPMITILNFAGLASATSIAAVLNCLMLLFYLPRKGVRVSYALMTLSFLKTAVAAGFAFYSARMLPFSYKFESELLNRFWNLLVPSATAVAIYLVLCVILKVQGFKLLLRVFLRKK